MVSKRKGLPLELPDQMSQLRPFLRCVPDRNWQQQQFIEIVRQQPAQSGGDSPLIARYYQAVDQLLRQCPISWPSN